MNINLDYLAGFTDGEGSIGIVGRGPRITWGQKDENTLRTIKDFLCDLGYHPNFYKVSKKLPRRPSDIFMMNLSRRDEVLSLINKIETKMVLKSSQCEVVRKWLIDNPSKANRGEIDVEKLRDLANQGYTMKNIAKEMHFSLSKIYTTSKSNNIHFVLGGKVSSGKHLKPMTREERLARRRERGY